MILPEALRLERNLIGLDTETTGTNPKTSRIVELALEIMRPDGTVKEWRTYINPGIPIPPGATAVHHITDAMVQGCRICGKAKGECPEAQPNDLPVGQAHFFQPWPFFSDLAENLKRGMTDVDFAGYNVRFDLKMLQAEFDRARVLWSYENARVIDGFRLWQVGDPRALTDAIEKFLTPEERAALAGEAHTALGDVRWSTRVIANQLAAFAKLPRDIQQLHDLCAPGWFDHEGKLQWRDGELVLGFGEHREVPLRRVPRSYLGFILRKDFSAKVKDAVRNALHGIYPTPPDYAEPRTEDVD